LFLFASWFPGFQIQSSVNFDSMSAQPDTQRMEKIVSLCKRRGFIFQSSEIYGGLNGLWDYGPLGVELKRNLKNYWWRVMVHERDDVVGMDGSILTHPQVLKASGHVEGFSDPMVDCRLTQQRFRADHIPSQSGTVYAFEQARDAIPSQEAFEVLANWAKDLLPVGRSVSRRDSIDLAMLVSNERKLGLSKPNNDPQRVFEFFTDFSEKMSTQSDVPTNEVESFRKAYNSSPVASGDSIRLLQRKGEDNATILKRANTFYQQRNILVPMTWFATEVVTSTRDFNPENGAELTPPRAFNLMFATHLGASTDEGSIAYLRPETAQSIFVQFKNVLDVSRKKLPFGIAQIGKAFRNEINPRNFTFRSREFEQMELEYFCRPEEGMKLLEYWKEERLKFYENIGIARDKLHVLTVPDEERAFYSKGTYDIEYDFPFGRQELEGVAYRTDYDLSQHQKASGKSLEYFDEETKQKFIPHVVEPSAGVDRTVLALICEAYSEDEAPDDKGKMETRIVLRFHPRMAPVKCAVFPLLKNKEQLVAKAKEIVDLLRPHMFVFYDESGAIGRRYRRQDEIGTPFGVTVDFETLGEKDLALRDTVTLRERDSMKQERVAIKDLATMLISRIA
jgi:glycyl-tRNA synthetase (class II)